MKLARPYLPQVTASLDAYETDSAIFGLHHPPIGSYRIGDLSSLRRSCQAWELRSVRAAMLRTGTQRPLDGQQRQVVLSSRISTRHAPHLYESDRGENLARHRCRRA